MKQEHVSEIKGIVILALSMILLASLVSFVPDDLPWYTSQPNSPTQNWIRETGAYLAGSLLFIIGYSAYFLVSFLIFWAWNKFSLRDITFTLAKFICSIILIAVISSLLSMLSPPDASIRFQRSGIVGLYISQFLIDHIGYFGSYVSLVALGLLTLIVTGEFLVSPLFVNIIEKMQSVYQDFITGFKTSGKKEGKPQAKPKPKINFGQSAVKTPKKPQAVQDDDQEYNEDEGSEEVAAKKQKKAGGGFFQPKIKITPNEAPAKNKEESPKVVGEYKLPPLDLLEDAPEISTSKIQSSLMNGAKLLEQTLASFNVSARVADIERGPAITRYELEPAPGVKVQKFTTLSDDIALAMKAPAVRIVAPIPGKNRVGIEVPNASSASVFLKDVLASDQFRSSKSKLTLSLGKDISGKPMIADLAGMPHLLIAGTTGAGKTVCVNGIIMSMLLNASPEEVKFVMVDPKMVELSQYNDIPHLLAPTVTDPKKASAVLNWVVSEMESRYKKLSKEGARNIVGYNAKGNKMPYIVVIIDELADLMQVSAKTVESSITRLAQLSRAVGIHLILATQRPSVDVITGVIKANFPARISFKVASKVDSRTVLDMNGAENLLGKGDMLFIQPGDAKPTRGQCSFVKDEEISRVIKYIKEQQQPEYDETILQQQKGGAKGGSEEKDDCYEEAVKLVMETNQASVSILQRRMRLGYTRAARLIDMMEQDGLVGPYVGSKPREILVDREQWLLENMNTEEAEDE